MKLNRNNKVIKVYGYPHQHGNETEYVRMFTMMGFKDLEILKSLKAGA